MRLPDTRIHIGLWVLAGWVGALGLAGCAVFSRGGGTLSSERERPPAFEMEASARLMADGQAWLDIRMTEPMRLTGLRQLTGGTAARVRWTVEVLARPLGDQLHEATWVEMIASSDSIAAAPIRSRSVQVPGGELLVAVTAEDEATGVGFTARQEVVVPTTEDSLAVFGVRLEALRPEPVWQPLVSHATTVEEGSLRVRAQVLHGAETQGWVMVERLEADSSVARPPFAMGRQLDALSVRGVRLEDSIRDTLVAIPVALSSELVDVSERLPSLRAGAYRIRVEAGDTHQDRILIVRRAAFPIVERVGDLVAAMGYIASESEMRALTARLDPFVQRRAFDRFWGDRIPDRRLAASTVRAYAERVEEANRLYSTHKEGWMTDRGMAFILFGAPQRIERDFYTLRWIYTSGPVSGLALEFVSTQGLPETWPYEVWVLQRGPAYDVAWQRARRAWRRGDVP